MTPSDPPPLTRRALLRGSLAAAAGVALGGCGPLLPHAGGASDARRLLPVRVSDDRVIRVLTGLRPFRPGGFVVRAEPFGGKTLIHNYGHGGAGITLCWGSSALAAELALETEHRRAAVIGCGALGLTAARLLQDLGFEVTIYARELPPETTSNIAGGQWSPYTVYDADAAPPDFPAVLERAARLSHRYFQEQVGAHYGVRWIDNYVLRRQPVAPRRAMADLYPATEVLQPHEHPFPFPHVRRFTTMLIEPPVFLSAVARDFLLRGGRIVVQAFAGAVELQALSEPLVVNCTGLGSRELFGDEALTPIKGQLVVLLPQSEVDYVTLAGDVYMFPRTDGIILGGSSERGEWSLKPDPGVTRRILEGNRRIFEGMGG